MICVPAPRADGIPLSVRFGTRNVPSLAVTAHVKVLVGQRNSATPLSVREQLEIELAVRRLATRIVPEPRTENRPVHGPVVVSAAPLFT